jgi:hypothetical protein
MELELEVWTRKWSRRTLLTGGGGELEGGVGGWTGKLGLGIGNRGRELAVGGGGVSAD